MGEGYAVCLSPDAVFFTQELTVGPEVAMWAIPELLPNKWRHIGVVIADTCVFFAVIVGPIVGRVAIDDGGHTWRWVYIAGAIATCCSGLGLYFCYFPPAHPRGVPFWDAIRGMDWIGMFLFTAGFAITLCKFHLVLTRPQRPNSGSWYY
jgi:MFS family permease